MTGAQLMDAIVDLARLMGYRAAHFAPARTDKGWRTPCRYDAKGWPDLVLVGRGGILYVEVKGDGDVLSMEQHDWLDALAEARAEWHVWTSKDWLDGTVERRLVSHKRDAA